MRSLTRKPCLFFIVCCLFALPVFGQAPLSDSTITGVVVDSASGAPLAYITVGLKSDSSIIKAAVTKEDGSFVFSALKPLRYSLTVMAMGFRKQTLQVDLAAANGRAALGSIAIVRTSSTLKEVKVTGEKPIISQQIDGISYDLQADPDSKGSNVLEMMRKVPHISLDADDNILLNGDAGYKVLVNGKPSSMVERNLKAVLRSMPASTIQRIDVITTPSSKYDGEGFGGIINIITNKRPADGYKGTINVNGRTPVGGPGVGGSFALKSGKWGISASGAASIHNTPETNTTIDRLATGSRKGQLLQHGTEKSNSRNGYIGAEISYEADSLNLVSLQLNINGNRDEDNNTQQSVLKADDGYLQRYDIAGEGETHGSGRDVSLNYQLGFKRNKKELLTFSYRYFAYDSRYATGVSVLDTVNYPLSDYKQLNKQGAAEQTAQVDYLFTIGKVAVESGVKAIFRNNDGDFQTSVFDYLTGNFKPDTSLGNVLRNRQQILAAYNTYEYGINGWSFKGGVRIEHTSIDADFISSASSVTQRYFNVMPAVSIGRKLGKKSMMTFGFRQRIKRPGVNQLNPFIDRSNPNVEKTGNPELSPALLNGIQLGYTYSGKVSIVTGVDYAFFNKLAIPVSTFIPETNVVRTRFENAGSGKGLSGSLNISYPATKRLNLTLNNNFVYIWTKSVAKGADIENQGFMYTIAASAGYRFDDGWRINGNVNVISPKVTFQGTSNSVVTSSLGVTKSLLKDKMSLSASLINPFSKYRNDIRSTFGNDFEQNITRQLYFRTISFNLNYNFGKLKETIQKNKRGIKNDDVSNEDANQ
nr:outer membrane beta-barrel protein [uncultured Chitinophaga sp.]